MKNTMNIIRIDKKAGGLWATDDVQAIIVETESRKVFRIKVLRDQKNSKELTIARKLEIGMILNPGEFPNMKEM